MELSEAISLLTSDEEEDRPIVPAAAAAESDGSTSRAPAAVKKRKRGGRTRGAGWRRRAGDATASVGDPPVSPESAAAAAAMAKASTAAALRESLLAFGLRPGARTKEGLSLRLLRARHAAAASEELYGGAAAAASITSARQPRFDAARAGRVSGSLEACRACGAGIAPPRRTFCSDECVHFHLLRTSGSHVRKALAIRDGRVCALCGIDAGAAYSAASRAVREALAAGTPAAAEALARSVTDGVFAGHAALSTNRRGRCKAREGSFWQADHVQGVAEGGGCCGLSNLRTLCTPCHAAVTAQQAGQRAAGRRAERDAAAGRLLVPEEDEEDEENQDGEEDGEDEGDPEESDAEDD